MASEAETIAVTTPPRLMSSAGWAAAAAPWGFHLLLIAGTFSTNTTENGGAKRRWQWRTLAINIVGRAAVVAAAAALAPARGSTLGIRILKSVHDLPSRNLAVCWHKNWRDGDLEHFTISMLSIKQKKPYVFYGHDNVCFNDSKKQTIYRPFIAFL